MLDLVVDRREMKAMLGSVLRFMYNQGAHPGPKPSGAQGN
jgi:hypothetical protein